MLQDSHASGVLIFRVLAVGALALDVAIRQEHALTGIIELLDRLT